MPSSKKLPAIVGGLTEYLQSVAISKAEDILKVYMAETAREVAAAFWIQWLMIEQEMKRRRPELLPSLEEADSSTWLTEDWLRNFVQKHAGVGNAVADFDQLLYDHGLSIADDPVLGAVRSLAMSIDQAHSGAYGGVTLKSWAQGGSTSEVFDAAFKAYSNGTLKEEAFTKTKSLLDIIDDTLVAVTGHGGSPSAEVLEQIFNQVFWNTKDILADAAATGIKSSLICGYVTSSDQIGIGNAFFLTNPRASAYAFQNAANMVTNVNSTTRAQLWSMVNDGIKNGHSYDRIARAIKTKFGEFAIPMPQKHIANRATLVAVTELRKAYEDGNMQVYKYLQDEGIPMMKRWKNSGDERVSAGCMDNGAEGWIPLDQTFISGAEMPPRFPGCRCTLISRVMRPEMLGTNASVSGFGKAPPSVAKAAKKPPIGAKENPAVSKAVKKHMSKPGATDTWDDFSFKDYYAEKTRAFKKKWTDMIRASERAGQRGWDAVRTYTGSSYQEMNRALRHAKLLRSQAIPNGLARAGTSRSASAALGSVVLEEPVTVYRKMGASHLLNDWGINLNDPSAIGAEFIDYGFSSCSISEGVWSGAMSCRIFVPPGVGRGAYVESISMHPSEVEFLLNRGTKFRIVSVEKRSGGAGSWLVDLEVID